MTEKIQEKSRQFKDKPCVVVAVVACSQLVVASSLGLVRLVVATAVDVVVVASDRRTAVAAVVGAFAVVVASSDGS